MAKVIGIRQSTPSFTVSGQNRTVIVTAREKNHHKKEKFIFSYKKQDYCLIYQKVKVKHLNGFEWFFETYFNQEYLKKNLRTEVNVTIQKGLIYNNQK